jgi:hypothetical protein
MRKYKLQKLLAVLSVIFALGALFFMSKPALAANPNLINFQGKVVNADGTNVTNGTYSFNFVLFDDPTAGTESDGVHDKWHELAKSVDVTNGTFQTELGSATTLPDFSQFSTLYLAIKFNGDSAGYMTPRIHLDSAPYAKYSDNSGALGGLTAANFVQLAQGLQTDSSTTNASIAINKTNSSGTPDILLLQKSGQNVLEVNNSGTVLLGQAGASGLNGTLTFNNSAGSNTVSLSLQANPGSSYTLLLPTTGPSTSQCLQTDGTTANQLTFAACATGGSGATSVAYSATPNANGGSITGSVLTLAKANGTNPGLLSADAQTIGGNKTFTSSINVQTLSNTSSALQVQNATASNIAAISTISFNQNLLANPSFEGSTLGWSGYGAGGVDTLTTTTTAAAIQSGSQGLQDVTTATANRGVKYLYNFKPNTAYTFSIYAAVSAGSTGSFFDIGRYENNVATTTSCPITQTLTTTLTRFTCTFTTGATINGATDGPFARYTDATNVYTIYFDAAQLEEAGGASAFADQNYPNLINNPSIESNTDGWNSKNLATISSSNDFAKFGNSSIKVVTTASLNDGVFYAYFFKPSTKYTFSFWAKRATGSDSYLAGYNAFTDTDCTTTPDISLAGSVTTTWTQYSCSFTTPSSINSGSVPYVYIKNKASSPSANTFYIDGATLVAGSTYLDYSQPAASLQAEPLYGNLSLNNSNVGELQPWQKSIFAIPNSLNSQTTVLINGYIYSIGGFLTSPSVYYSKLNSDGTPSQWQTNTYSLPAPLSHAVSVAANGFIYFIGGINNSNAAVSTVYYAKANADGSTGPWQTSTNSLPVNTARATSVLANGYIYIIGGTDLTTESTTVYYARVNSDGSTSAWSVNANAPPARENASTAVYNGYVYQIGGDNGGSPPSGTAQTSVYYSKLNSDGSTGTWQASSNSLPKAEYYQTSVVVNGYLYVIGGRNGATYYSSVYYSKLNADGTNGLWQTSSNTLPHNLAMHASVASNGYIYTIGGADGAASVNTVFYTSTSRITVGGSLDLVGLSGQTAGDPGNNGGSLTAGNTSVLGSLDVRDQANFTQNVGIGGALTVNGGATVQGAAGSTNIFQIQNSGMINLFNASTVNLISNSSFETGPTNVDNQVAGWTKKLGSESSIKNQTTAPQYGSQSLELITTTVAQQGVKSTVRLAASTQYTFSFYAKVSAGSFATLTFGRSDTGSGETDCVTTGSITTAFTRFSCTFTSGSGTVSGSYVYISRGTDTTARTIYIDGVQLETGATASDYRNGDLSIDSLATFKSTANSTSAFQVQNSGGSSVFNIDTTKSNSNNLVANSSFESALTNWSALNSGTPTQDSTQAYEQTHSLKIATGTNASGGGASYSTGGTFLANGTTYTLSAYVKSDSNAPVTTLEIGHADNGITPTLVSCLTGQSLPVSGGWKRFTCTWTSGTVTGTPFIYFKQTDNVNRNLYIDDVLLQTDANADTSYRNAAINLTGTIINSPVVLQNASNSTNAFQVQNSGGSTIFNIDDTDNNLFNNPSFEVNTTGWTAFGSTINRDATQSYAGNYSLLVSTTNQFQGISYTFTSTSPQLTFGTTYTVSWYARLASGTAPTFIYAGDTDNNGTTNTFCTPPTVTILATGWTRFTCTYTASEGSAVGGHISIEQSNIVSNSWYIDGIKLEATSSASAYGSGTISLDGIISSPTTFKAANSTTAFQVQNAGGSTVLGIDTTNFNIFLGNTTNSNQVKIASGTTSSTYTITLPTAASAGTNYCLVGTTSGGTTTTSFMACGAGSTRAVSLTPEYAGAVMTGDGTSNTGTMTSDFCSGSGVGGLNINASVCGTGTATHNYYSWTASATNDYDVWVRWQAPSDFSSFGSNAFTLNGWTTSASDSAALTVYDASNTSCGTGTVSTTATWGTAQITPSGCTVSAGDILSLKIHLNVAVTGEFARSGEITIVYNRN